MFFEDIKPFRINIGPSHNATHHLMRIEADIVGEKIVYCELEIGYVHRCFEKMAENMGWNQVITLTDRLNYCSCAINNVSYVMAVEKLIGIDVPERCTYIRTLLCELSRIFDHLVCIGAFLVDMGALTNFWYLFREREYIYDIIETICGQRLTTSLTRIGGLYRDMPDGFEQLVRDKTVRLKEAIDDIDSLITKNRIAIDRMKGIGAISQEVAKSYGWTGPCLRATGVPYDVRKSAPYLLYDKLDFKVPLGTNGDAFDRYLVRMEEVRQSYHMVEQLIEGIPAGPVNVDNRYLTLPLKNDVYNNIEGLMNHFKLVMEGPRVPEGEVYGFSEAANGELGFYIVSNGSKYPYRIKVRPPCFVLWQAFPHLVKGHMMADTVAIMAGLNIIAGEIDR